MLSIPEALDTQAKAALTKARDLKRPGAFAVSGLLGGAYVGVGVILMVSTAGPLLAAGDPLTKLVSGLVFGVALTLVVFAGAELVTSTMMTAVQGFAAKSIGGRTAVRLIAITFALNFVGAALFAALIVASGVLETNAAAGAMVHELLLSKSLLTPLELVVRGTLCNLLVCLAVWMGVRIVAPGPRIAVILLAMLAFVSAGFEHVVANMTTYWIGVLLRDPAASAPLFAENMLFVGLGNLVGGGLLVGIVYWVLAGRPRGEAAEQPLDTDAVRP